ncbi:FABP family protein [Rhodococcus kronopolitis]|uniref:FABP family protein n=1 Tax=Rhodococcus kronopolitis TaxID=1460226 RepID=A0ABV9FSV7_9NOCA
MTDAVDRSTPLDPLGSLASFAGRWVGGGDGHYPTIDDFSYEEEIEFTATPGKPFLGYRSRTWSPGRGRPMHTENGYLRRAAGEAVELLVSQPTGFVEVHRGEVRDGVLELTQLTLSASPDAKPVHEIRRRLVVDGDELRYDMWMSHAQTPMTHHLQARLQRG